MATFTPDSALVSSTALSPNRTVTSGRYARLVVIHTMETTETSSTAENIGGGWFTQAAAVASAHYNVDNNSIVQGVPEKDMAWAAPGTNEDGIQIEHAGRAAQTAAEWQDAYSLSMLELSAQLVADICARNSIPPVRISNAQLAAGAQGIIDHAQASAVYRLSDHYDVGSGFPWDWYMGRVQAYYYGGAQATTTTTTQTIEKDWFDMATKQDLEDVVFNTKRPEFGNRTLAQIVREVDTNTWGTKKMVRYLFNQLRIGIPGIATDGALGVWIRRLLNYDGGGKIDANTELVKKRQQEWQADAKRNFDF